MNYLELIGKFVVISVIINVLISFLIFIFSILYTPKIQCTTYAKDIDGGWYVKYKNDYYYTKDNINFEPVYNAVMV